MNMMMKKRKLIPMSRATARQMDTVERAKAERGDRRAMDILLEAQRCWDKMSRYRAFRRRCWRYVNGDQWSDIVEVGGRSMSEEEYIKRQGGIPLKQNMMKKTINTVAGVYRSQNKEPVCTARDRDEQSISETMSIILQCNRQVNQSAELEAESFKEFLVSGMVIHAKSYGWRNNRLDCWTDIVSPDEFFMNPDSKDIRMWDVRICGRVIDATFEDVCSNFAQSAEDYKLFRKIYDNAKDRAYLGEFLDEFGVHSERAVDFLYSSTPGKCRVIEVWRKESKPRYMCHDMNRGELYKIDVDQYAEIERENKERLKEGKAAGMPEEEIPLIEATWFMDSYWYYYYLSPTGEILKEGETPFEHGGTPFVIRRLSNIDGVQTSLAGDFIDQQRYVNRLVMMHEWIMKSSAKGVLLFPEECKPDGMSMEDIAEEWSKFNGVIAIKTKAGAQIPKQISSNATNIGITELLNLQLRFFEEISGVNGPLQGKPGYAGMSGVLYAQQTQNSTTSLLDYLDTFSAFVVDGAYKDVKNMQQFYDDRRRFKIAGKRSKEVVFDRSTIGETEFDLSITESTMTQEYRQVANQFLMQIWQSGQINLEQLLQTGDFPFADELLQSVQSMKEQMQAQQQVQGEALPAQDPTTETQEQEPVRGSLEAQMQNVADRTQVQKAYEMLRGMKTETE